MKEQLTPHKTGEGSANKTRPIRSPLIWRMGNAQAWDKVTKKTPSIASDSVIVVHAPNHLGDNIMAIPLVMALVEKYTNITVISRAEYSIVWKTLSNRLHVVSYTGWRREEKNRLREYLSQSQCELAFLLATGMEVAWLYVKAGIRHRLGFDYWGRGILLTARIRSYHQPTSSHLVNDHFSNNMLKLLSLLPECSELSDSDKQVDLQKSYLTHRGTRTDRRRLKLGIALAGNTPDKCPAPQFWHSLIKQCRKELAVKQVRLFGAVDQAARGDRLSLDDHDIINLCGKTSVESLMENLQLCDFVISPDSGIAHLAAALGIPTFVIFTSGSPVWTAPAGNFVYVFESNLDCSPCFNEKPCNRGYQCIIELDAGLLVDRIKSFYRASGVPGKGQIASNHCPARQVPL